MYTYKGVFRILYNNFIKIIPWEDDGQQTKSNSTNNHQRQWIDKEKEILVVPFANTVVYPGTVVVKIL